VVSVFTCLQITSRLAVRHAIGEKSFALAQRYGIHHNNKKVTPRVTFLACTSIGARQRGHAGAASDLLGGNVGELIASSNISAAASPSVSC
jgi:hypothetical protein